MILGKAIIKINEVRICTEVLPFISHEMFRDITDRIMDMTNVNVNFTIPKL